MSLVGNMATSNPRIILSTILCLLLTLAPQSAWADSCNTSGNPSCGNVKAFASLCCPWPNLCYYVDRLGTPGCCPAGAVCLSPGFTSVAANGGGATVIPITTTIYATQVATVTAEQSTLTVVPASTTTVVSVPTVTTLVGIASTTTLATVVPVQVSTNLQTVYSTIATVTQPSVVTVGSVVTIGSVVTPTVIYSTTITGPTGSFQTVGGLIVASGGTSNKMSGYISILISFTTFIVWIGW